jgi:hypothetical protein
MTDTRDTAAPQPCPEGWVTEELERIFAARTGTPITANMKRAACAALKCARGYVWSDGGQEWTAPPPTQPEGHEAWMLEAERLIEDYAGARAETAVFNVTQQSGMSVRMVRPRLAALLAHLRTKGE